MSLTQPPDLQIPATQRTPAVTFQFTEARLRLSGESYPENVSSFYAPILATLDLYLAGLQGASISCEIALRYFNSSSAKALLNLLSRLAGAVPDNHVRVSWHYDPDDDIMKETGEDFAVDLPGLAFEFCPLPV